jgi:hypothetical protein
MYPIGCNMNKIEGNNPFRVLYNSLIQHRHHTATILLALVIRPGAKSFLQYLHVRHLTHPEADRGKWQAAALLFVVLLCWVIRIERNVGGISQTVSMF